MRILLADLDLAMTFLEIARTTTDASVRQRNRENARKAYETVLRFQLRLVPTAEEKKSMEEKLGNVRDGLERP